MFFLASMGANCSCCKLDDTEVKKESGKINTIGRVYAATIILDIFVSLTTLVVGILAKTGTIPGISSVGSDALLGTGGFILTAWIFLSLCTKGKIVKDAYDLLGATVSSNPRLPRKLFMTER